jgi:hypothetical protein
MIGARAGGAATVYDTYKVPRLCRVSSLDAWLAKLGVPSSFYLNGTKPDFSDASPDWA